jgi:hypothetical protein
MKRSNLDARLDELAREMVDYESMKAVMDKVRDSLERVSLVSPDVFRNMFKNSTLIIEYPCPSVMGIQAYVHLVKREKRKMFVFVWATQHTPLDRDFLMYNSRAGLETFVRNIFGYQGIAVSMSIDSMISKLSIIARTASSGASSVLANIIDQLISYKNKGDNNGKED